MSKRPHPDVLPHGELREVFPNIYLVTGSMKMAGRPLTFSRNMTVIRENSELTLLNSVRLDEHGLGQLEKLGKVTNVIRLAGFHGYDDAFYKEKYNATAYAIEGQSYVEGFDLQAAPYFEPDVWLNAGDELPVEGARLYTFNSCKVPEAVLVLLREGGILVSGDALQNWHKPDVFFNFMARIMMRFAGFVRPCQVGPGWFKFARPAASDLRGLLDLRFDHVLPAHGEPVIGDAATRYRASIEKMAGLAEQHEA